VHRLGQTHPVQVIHLLTEQSIEERVWETLKLKRALFTGLFDSTSDEVSFEKLGRKSTMQVIKEVFCDQPAGQKPVISPQAPAPVGIEEVEKAREAATQISPAPETSAEAVGQRGEAAAPRPYSQELVPDAESSPAPDLPDVGQATAKFLEAGLSFLEALVPPAAGVVRAQDYSRTIERAFSSLLRTDPQTQRPVLAVPLPESFSAERVAGAISGLLCKLAGTS
jgi:hypothetical protein